ncbi:hypothetical protein TevJSym_ax00370 [endosymbiont of Tevnia jerichonana (vent Tica)]|uniref:Uncharacterized protein n=1 Tax=endosymbiont of Tevnia jerichonana (vent Tica) TaxID=1049564 RepID=G2FHW0_9GAMM|nr:hypothetical protein TevJSym_ax00370 [endosymbiont of Tevnia jerichonana (vent Tica)]
MRYLTSTANIKQLEFFTIGKTGLQIGSIDFLNYHNKNPIE